MASFGKNKRRIFTLQTIRHKVKGVIMKAKGPLESLTSLGSLTDGANLFFPHSVGLFLKSLDMDLFEKIPMPGGPFPMPTKDQQTVT